MPEELGHIIGKAPAEVSPGAVHRRARGHKPPGDGAASLDLGRALNSMAWVQDTKLETPCKQTYTIPWIKVLFTILLGKEKKKNQGCGPLVGERKQISEQLFKRAHFCFDHRMKLETAFFWLHCILSTSLLMPNHISPLLKHRPFFCSKQLF